MKKLMFILILTASLQLKGGSFVLEQKEAVLGEPVILEVRDLKLFEFPAVLYVEEPVTLCIDISKYQNEERINLVDIFKIEGEYKISLTESTNICDIKKEIEALKNGLEFEKDERERGYLKEQLKYKENSLTSALNKLHRYASFKIKINYPVGFDKNLYENYFKGRENLEEFWYKSLY